MEIFEMLSQIKHDILDIKKTISANMVTTTVSDKWVSRSNAMTFLNYGATQMAELEKSGDIVVTKIGKRKFILKESLENLLNKNINN